MAIPNAPVEGGLSKMAFAVYDNSGTNAAAIERAYQIVTQNGTVVGDIGVYPTSGTLGHGYKATTAGTAIQITTTSTPCQGVIVKADPDNTEDVWVGTSALTADKTAATAGYRLAPGESIGVPCRNANTVYIRRGASTNQGAYWIASKD